MKTFFPTAKSSRRGRNVLAPDQKQSTRINLNNTVTKHKMKKMVKMQLTAPSPDPHARILFIFIKKNSVAMVLLS